MSQDFNQFMNSALDFEVQDEVDNTYGMRHGDVLKLGIVAIQPLKTELEAANVPLGVDPRTVVPWNEGLSLNCIVLAVKDIDGRLREMTKLGEEGEVAFPFGTLNVDRFVRVTARDITGGFVRQPTEDGRSAKIMWPSNWDRMTPAQRLSYWMHWIGLKYALPKGAVQEGTVFYGYHSVRKGKEGTAYEGKYFTDIAARIQDPATGNWIPAPSDIKSFPLEHLRAVKAGLTRAYEEYKARKEQQDTSFNYGSNANTPPFDVEAGF